MDDVQVELFSFFVSSNMAHGFENVISASEGFEKMFSRGCLQVKKMEKPRQEEILAFRIV